MADPLVFPPTVPISVLITALPLTGARIYSRGAILSLELLRREREKREEAEFESIQIWSTSRCLVSEKYCMSGLERGEEQTVWLSICSHLTRVPGKSREISYLTFTSPHLPSGFVPSCCCCCYEVDEV